MICIERFIVIFEPAKLKEQIEAQEQFEKNLDE